MSRSELLKVGKKEADVWWLANYSNLLGKQNRERKKPSAATEG